MRFGQERHERGDQLGGRQQALVERPVGVELVGRLLVARSRSGRGCGGRTSCDRRIDELVEPLAGGEVVVGVHPLDDRGGRAVQLAEDPAIELAALGDRAIAFAAGQIGRRKLADVRRRAAAAGSKPSMFA